MGAQQSSPSPPSSAPVAPSSTDAASKPKVQPCCVCKDEKAKRDECMLFSKAADPEKDCQSTIDAYRKCMDGYGFKV